MVLRLLFCFSFILSGLWFAMSASYVNSRIGWDNMMSMNPSDLAFFITAVCIPVVILWVVMGLFYYGGIIQKQGEFMEVMLYYMKDSADRNRIMSKSLLESREMLRSSENMRYIDTFILELNNVITEIAIRFNILRRSSAETLWNKVHAGDRWAFCNVILDNARDIPDFDFALAKSAIKDRKLAQAIDTFCQRVEHLLDILKQNESSAMFADIIETSNLGELYRRMASVNEQQRTFNKSFEPSAEEEEIQNNTDDSLFAVTEETHSKDKNKQSKNITAEDTTFQILPIDLSLKKDLPTMNMKTEIYHSDSDDWENKKKEIMSNYSKFEASDDED